MDDMDDFSANDLLRMRFDFMSSRLGALRTRGLDVDIDVGGIPAFGFDQHGQKMLCLIVGLLARPLERMREPRVLVFGEQDGETLSTYSALVRSLEFYDGAKDGEIVQWMDHASGCVTTMRKPIELSDLKVLV